MKKILSSILAAAMIVGVVLSAFPAVVSAADDAEPLHVQEATTSLRNQIATVAGGMYGITIMAKGGIAGSAEITKTITFVVDPADLTAGSVAVSVSGNTAKKPVTLTATRSGINAADDVLYRFDIYNAKTGAIMVSAYGPEASCTWIPAKAGTYEVRVKAINQNSFGMYDVIGTTTVEIQ